MAGARRETESPLLARDEHSDEERDDVGHREVLERREDGRGSDGLGRNPGLSDGDVTRDERDREGDHDVGEQHLNELGLWFHGHGPVLSLV